MPRGGGTRDPDVAPTTERSLAGPPPDEPEADQAGGEQVEAEQDVEPALVADGEPAEAGEPRQRALDHPAVAAQPLGAVDPAPCYPRDDAPSPGRLATVVVVVPFVRVQLAWPLPRPTGALPDRRHGIQQRLEKATVVDVGGAEQERERDAARIDQDVAFGPRLAAVGRVAADARAPFFAGNEALSSEQRPKSIAFARPNRSSNARWSRSKTPAACQSLSRRQQVMPEPQPISCGSIAQGMPLRSTNRMPANALRSSTGGRPPFGRGLGGGRSGATKAHSSSETSTLAIEPLSETEGLVPRFCYALLTPG